MGCSMSPNRCQVVHLSRFIAQPLPQPLYFDIVPATHATKSFVFMSFHTPRGVGGIHPHLSNFPCLQSPSPAILSPLNDSAIEADRS